MCLPVSAHPVNSMAQFCTLATQSLRVPGAGFTVRTLTNKWKGKAHASPSYMHLESRRQEKTVKENDQREGSI